MAYSEERIQPIGKQNHEIAKTKHKIRKFLWILFKLLYAQIIVSGEINTVIEDVEIRIQYKLRSIESISKIFFNKFFKNEKLNNKKYEIWSV